MAVSFKHVLAQGPVLATLGRVALQSLGSRPASRAVVAPGPWITATLPPRPADLLAAYVRHVGGDPAAYRGEVPPHLFPQWSFPLVARAMEGAPYPMVRVLNAGCAFASSRPLPAGEPLVVRARLAAVDDDGRRALLTHEIITGTASAPDALRSELRAYVPLARRADGARPATDARRSVPADAREIAFWRLAPDAGLDFAKLTGDFNPIHWLAPYARAAGLRGTILHGFATFARAIESLQRGALAGGRVRRAEARFVRPLPLPSRVGLYLAGPGAFQVGDAPGGGVYLDGTFSTSEPLS